MFRIIILLVALVAGGGAAWIALTMKSVDPEESAASTTGMGDSGWTITWTSG